MHILAILAPIFVIILLGYLLRVMGIVRPIMAHALNTFVYYISLPALIVVSFWKIDWRAPELWSLFWFQIISLSIFFFLVWAAIHLLRLGHRACPPLLVSSTLGNTVYIGFPIGLVVFGEAGAAALVGAGTIQLIAGIILSFLAIEILVMRTRNWRVYLNDIIRNPLILATAIGLLLAAFVRSSSVPAIMNTLSALSATASPLALFALGVFLHGKFVHSHLSWTIASSAVKLLLFPFFTLILARLWGLPPLQTNISVLIAAMPSAVTSFVLAEKYDLQKDMVATSIFVSTLLSAATIFCLLVVLSS